MRIAYLCADPGIPLFGRKGCSTHVRETCRSLRALGHEIKVIGSNLQGESSAEELRDVIGVEPFTSRRWGFDVRNILLDRRVRRCLGDLARTWKPNAIYERYSLYSQAGTWCSRKFGVPRVVEVNAFLTHELKGARGHVSLLASFAGLVEHLSRRASRPDRHPRRGRTRSLALVAPGLLSTLSERYCH